MTEQKSFKTFDEYVKEAEITPFELPINSKKTLKIEAPTGNQLMRFTDAYRQGDTEQILHALAGEKWPELAKVLYEAPYQAMQNVLDDMVRHFKLVPNQEMELRNATGAKVVESDPDKIKALQRAGFKIVGESQPRS